MAMFDLTGKGALVTGASGGIGGDIAFANDVCVELEVFAQAAFLLALVAEQLREREPLDRFLELPLLGADHARQGGRHLRPQRDDTFAFVHKVVELADNFIAALGGEEF